MILPPDERANRPAIFVMRANSVVFITTEDPLEAVAPSKPLAHFNAAVHDAVGFAVFCGLSIVTGTVVWASFI